MNTKALVFAVAAACIGSVAPAFAASNHDGDRYDNSRYENNRYSTQRDRYEDQRDRRDERDDRRYDRQQQRAYERDVRHDRREIREEVRHYNQHVRGAGPRYDLYRGGRLPSAYYGDRYVVRDYQRYHLSAPARGYQWVRAGNDYLMVALATGIIAQVLLN